MTWFESVKLGALLLATPISAGPSDMTIDKGAPPGVQVQWMQTVSSPGDDWINDIVPIGCDRFALVGFVDRRDQTGADWRAYLGLLDGRGRSQARHEFGAGKGVDAFWTAMPGEDGETWLAGFTSRTGAGGIDAWAVRVDQAGGLVREWTFGGKGYDRFTSMAKVDGGYIFVGHSEPEGIARRRLLAVKLDHTGSPIWERVIDADPDALAALYVEPAGDGGVIVAGGLGRGGDSDIFVLKLDAEGKELWRSTVGTPEAPDINHGLLVRADGTIVVVGYVKSWGSRDNDLLAATFSSDGKLINRSLLGGADDDRPILIKADPAGRPWISGYTKSAGAGDWDIIVARLDERGDFMPGVVTIGGPGDDQGTAVRPLADGSAIVAGYRATEGSAQDAVIIRLSPGDWTKVNANFERRKVP